MRKKWSPKEEITPALLKSREKRKWQIALRRYVIHRVSTPFYAPYFGLDIKNMRQWFEHQFIYDLNWENFGKKWQFGHIIPVTYFDWSNKEELMLCWNFTNIGVEAFELNKDRSNRWDLLSSKNYFTELFATTGYYVCGKLLKKIEQIEISDIISTKAQQQFIKDHSGYLDMIRNYSEFEFELLNSGKSVEDVRREITSLKNIKFP